MYWKYLLLIMLIAYLNKINGMQLRKIMPMQIKNYLIRKNFNNKVNLVNHVSSVNFCEPAKIPLQQVKKLLGTSLSTVIYTMKERVKSKKYQHSSSAASFSWLPGYMIKLNSDRIKGALILQDCINRNNLYKIKIPKQWQFPIEDIRIDLDICLTERIEGTLATNALLNLEQTKQLVILIKETNYADLKPNNLIVCPNGDIALIDTEPAGFAKKPEYGLGALLYGGNSFSEEALSYLIKEIAAIEN